MNRKLIAVLAGVLFLMSVSLLADKKEKVKVKTVKVKTEKVRPVQTKKIERINTNVNRLETILFSAQNSSVAFPRPTLTKVANEANSLANKIWADVHSSHWTNTDTVNVARDLRMHVREMHKAAANGDAAGVRLHAGQALTFATRLDGMV